MLKHLRQFRRPFPIILVITALAISINEDAAAQYAAGQVTFVVNTPRLVALCDFVQRKALPLPAGLVASPCLTAL